MRSNKFVNNQASTKKYASLHLPGYLQMSFGLLLYETLLCFIYASIRMLYYFVFINLGEVSRN